MTISVDRAGPDDWRRVRALRVRALRDAPDAFWTTLAEEQRTGSEEAWRDRLTRPDAATFLARRDDADVGLAIGARHHALAHHAGLYAVWIAPDARGGGIAGLLVDAVVAWARAAGYPALRLDVSDDNAAAIRAYERYGFQPTGNTSVFPPPRDHIHEHELVLPL